MRCLVVAASTLLLAGCASGPKIIDPVEVADGVYLHSASNPFWWGSTAKEKAKVIREAQLFCKSQGKKLKILSMRTNEDAERELAAAGRDSQQINVAVAVNGNAYAGGRRKAFVEMEFSCQKE